MNGIQKALELGEDDFEFSETPNNDNTPNDNTRKEESKMTNRGDDISASYIIYNESAVFDPDSIIECFRRE